MKRFCISVLIGILIAACTDGKKSPDNVGAQLFKTLSNHIISHYMPPEQYVLSAFENHDIVFIGERHRIKHDVELIRDLIPLLHSKGIYNLGIEFADYQDQSLIDSLIDATEYDEQLARWIQFNQWPFWGFQDYIDIYKAAWQLNTSLSDDKRKFRVVGLNAATDWSYIWSEEDLRDPEIRKKAFPFGSGDIYMGRVILREFVAEGEKALIYSGINHAYTRYHQPYQDDGEWAFSTSRMGNVVYDSIGSRCMTIFLHNPWPARNNFGHETYPVDTLIDRLMLTLPDRYRRVGFDILSTPFAGLPGESSWWANGYNNFTLGDYCDGYIFQKPLHEYEGVAVADGFIDEANRRLAAAQSANPATKDSTRSAEDLMRSMRRDTEIQRIFGLFGLAEPLEADR